jgi:hypothetical protein
MFANVVRARILKSEVGDTGREVAIKIIRHQESMSVSSNCRCRFTDFLVQVSCGSEGDSNTQQAETG